MWKKEMDPLTKMKIKSFIISQLILIVDGMALMSRGKMFFKILVLFVTVVTVYWNVYDYYKEVKKNEVLENVENDK